MTQIACTAVYTVRTRAWAVNNMYMAVYTACVPVYTDRLHGHVHGRVHCHVYGHDRIRSYTRPCTVYMAVFTAHIYGLYTTVYTAVYMARTRLCTVMYMGCKHSHVHGTGLCTRQGAFTARVHGRVRKRGRVHER